MINMQGLDNSIWTRWEKSGSHDFLKAVRDLIPKDNDDTKTLIDSGGNDQDMALKRLVYDLFSKGLKGVLTRDQVVQSLGETTLLHPEMASVVTDVMAVVDAETAMMGVKEERERFVGIVKESEKYLSDGTLKERLDIDTLGDAGIVKNSKKFFTMVIKLKTKLFYKQQKFNLFREECEGYAKLITELNQDMTNTTPEEVLRLISSIIGYFNLDPNRVLDIILESFECQLNQHEFFIALLREYTPDPETLNELLGFKFQFYLNKKGKHEQAIVPPSLYRQTALMIQHNILDLEAIYELLGPKDNEIQNEATEEFNKAKEFVKRMNIVSTKDKDDKDKEEKNADSEETDPTATFGRNQKFGLLEALLEVGAWSHATILISRLPMYYAVTQVPIARALTNLIHATIDPVHQKFCGLTNRIKSKRYPALHNKGAPKPVTSFEEFQETVVPMLLALGPYASDDPVLLYKILRILKADLGVLKEDGKERDRISKPIEEGSSTLYYDVLTLMDEVFLPSLSLSEGNCSLAEEIWSILRVYPYHYRYRLYGSWKADTYSIHPLLLRKKVEVQKKAKAIMQRISKENVKPSSRKIGKVTHSSPTLMFDYILSQIQLYDNLIGPVVDSLKYLTNLSFDVLSYSIVEALNNPEKDRTKHDGTSISLWLQSLSNFCGAVYKKYNLELTGILQYVANQLKSKKSLDLLILKEIVHKMSGIEASEEMTNEQIDAMAGGELLKQEASSFNQVKNTKKSSQRLKDCLIDNELAVPLCLLMAQQRNCVVYQETEDSHLKLVGKLFDQCQDTLVQFGQFLASNLSIDDYTEKLPEIDVLLTRYHVNSDLAFFLARPMFNHQIFLKFEETRKQDKLWKTKTDEERQALHVETAIKVMEPVTEAIRPTQSQKVWDDISPQFLSTFWSLTMYDLFVPETVYEKEITKLKNMPSKIDENRELNNARKKKEKERVAALMDKLVEEKRRQKDHVEKIMARLRKEKDSWFFSRSAKLAKNETITTFLQLCLFPRCIFTASDAIYCAKFVQVIHALKTPNFSTLICFDRIFCDITYTVTSCTENEAQRYGRFLAAMLEIVNRWHSAKEIFERECVGYPGFVTKFRVTTPEKAADKSDDHVDYENYRHVCHKWHYKIAKALVVCLESKDYVQIRNALTVLTKILPHFPLIVNLGGVIEKRIEKVCTEEKEQRKDLYIKATSYSGLLKSRKNHMLKEHEFHQAKPKPGETSAASTPPTAATKSVTAKSDAKNSSRERITSSRDRDSNSRSQSRERSVSKDDRKSKERASRERSRDPKDRKEDRQSKERDSRGGEMGPPQPVAPRRSAEPSTEDRDSKKRKIDQPDEEPDRRDRDRKKIVEKRDSAKKERKRSDDAVSKDGSKRAKKDTEDEHQTNGDLDGRKPRSNTRKPDSKNRK